MSAPKTKRNRFSIAKKVELLDLLNLESLTENRVCSTTDAKHYLTELRRFFESRAFTLDVDFSSIAKLGSSLLKNVNNNQTSIPDFFQ